MNLFLYIIVFIFGLIIGSFLNCLIYRIEEKQSFLKGRSYCPYCKQTLSWMDLIPVLGFIFLKGKCRYCNKKISFQYPLVEIATAFLFILLLNYGSISVFSYSLFSILNFLFLILISSFLIIIFIYDLKHFIIPDKIIFPLIGITFLYQLSRIWNLESDIFRSWMFLILSAISAFFFFLFLVLITKGKGMGLGDVKLGFFMGLFLGFPDILVALFLAFTIGAIIGITLILLKKKTLKSEVPFGPFLIIGTFIAFFWTQTIINWYFQLFF